MSGIVDAAKAPSKLHEADRARGHGAVEIARRTRLALEQIADVPPDAEPATTSGSYPAVLGASAIFVPTVAMVMTLILVLLVEDGMYRAWLPVLGLCGALAVWLVASALVRTLADAQHSIPSSYGELLPRLAEVKCGLSESRVEVERSQDPGVWIAYEEAINEVIQIQRELATPGIRWLLATGYSTVWTQLYHAEEAMIEIAPISRVIQDADRDEARLNGSDIGNRVELLAMLRAARRTLSPERAKADDQRLLPIAGVTLEQQARGVLRYVHASLDEYRNARWNGLIQARNRLLASFTLTAIIIFLLLAIVIMAGAPKTAIMSAAVFYLVGATIGLGNRLRSESLADSAIPDYGLSAARLITIPLFSGLAAIAGLIMTPLLAGGQNIPSLARLFSLPGNVSGLLVAAVFGLTPGLLFDRLQTQSEKYKADLKSSRSTDGSTGDAASRMSASALTASDQPRRGGKGRRPNGHDDGDRVSPRHAASQRGAARTRARKSDGDHSATQHRSQSHHVQRGHENAR